MTTEFIQHLWQFKKKKTDWNWDFLKNYFFLYRKVFLLFCPLPVDVIKQFTARWSCEQAERGVTEEKAPLTER